MPSLMQGTLVLQFRFPGRRENDAGFTLVELLVVMLILGVLATIAIPSFIGQREKSWNAAAKSDSRNMSKLITALEADGRSPISLTLPQIEAAGFEATPNIEHGYCAKTDGSFAIGSRHLSSESIWIVDLDGRLVELIGTNINSALIGISGGCDVYSP